MAYSKFHMIGNSLRWFLKMLPKPKIIYTNAICDICGKFHVWGWLRAFVPGRQDVKNCDKGWTRWDVTRHGQGLTSCNKDWQDVDKVWQVVTRIDKMWTRFDKLWLGLTRCGQGFDKMCRSCDKMWTRFDKMWTRFDKMWTRCGAIWSTLVYINSSPGATCNKLRSATLQVILYFTLAKAE